MAKRTARRLILGAVLALVTWACSVSETKVPSPAGPSEFALSFALTATPDSISQDGASQSSIVVTARDVNGKTISGLVFRMDMFVDGLPGDYGTLSGKTLVTGSDGRASAVYTSPPPSPAGSSPTCIRLPGTCVTISATPMSTGFTNGTVSQTVVIHLVPVGVILPPAATPTAQFVITPAPPLSTNVRTNFDGTASCAGPATGTPPNAVCNPTSNTIVSYQWGFGDGGAATGRTASHSYSTPGTFTVTLTVTNDGGKFATATQTITVAASKLPTPVFICSPGSPVIGQVIQCNASQSTADTGRSIVSYLWNWGEPGAPNSTGLLASHSYGAAGVFSVTLTVADDAGQSATVGQTVTVGQGNPIAVLLVSKTGGLSIQADGSQSTASAPSTVATYTFIWGDGTQSGPSATPVASHTYPALVPPALSETFTVTLRVTDTATPARSGTASQAITVP
jgi:PKD repeat protein